MAKPKVIKGRVTLTERQFRLLLVTAAQCDYAVSEGDGDCLEAAGHNAKLALKSIGEKTAEQERKQREDEDD
jgi:hypothetical protein